MTEKPANPVDKALDRIHKLWPVALAAIAAIAAWGASSAQLAALGRGQDAMAAEQKLMAADVRRISESLAGLQSASQFTRDNVAELQRRMSALEAWRP